MTSNRKKFFYNGILLSAVGITMRTVVLFFNAFITRAVGAEGIGLYTVVMTVYNFAVTFATSGIALTMTRLVASAVGEGDSEKVSSTLSGGIIYALFFSSVATVVLFLGADVFGVYILSDERCSACLRILAPSLVPLALVSVFSGYFVGVRKVSCNAVTQILGQIFKIAVTMWLVSRIEVENVEESAKALSVGTTLAELICFIVIFVEFLIDRRLEKRSRSRALGEVSKTAIPLALSAYIRQALLTVEHILIPKSLERGGDNHSQALASYGMLHGMALPMVLYPMSPLSSFSGLLVPEFAERSAKGARREMERLAGESFSATLVYAVAISALLFVFSEELGYVVYNSALAGKYIAILAPVVPIMYLDHVTDSVLKGIGEQVYSMWVNITDSILSIFLVWLLIPRMGIGGYAVCIIVMEAYNFVLSFVRLRGKIPFRISFVKTVIAPLAAALLSAYVSQRVFINAGAQTSPLWLALEIVFAVCIFFASYKVFELLYYNIKESKNFT